MAEELGAVVLDAEDRRAGWRPLRPLAICAALLVLVEIALRLACAPDERVLADPLHPYGCFREEALQRLAEARAREAGSAAAPLDVVLLGDSVLSSVNNGPGERVEDALGPRLQAALGRPVRVTSLGRGGAHAADQLAALRQLQGALGPAPRRLALVVSTNVIFFSRRHAAPPMLYPCLAEHLAGEAEVPALLRLPAPPSALERGLTRWLTRNVYLLQQRRRLGEALFGGPPRDALRERALGLLGRLGLRGQAAAAPAVTDPNTPWTERGLSAAQFAASYDFIPPLSKEAINFQVTRRLGAALGELARGGVPVLAALVPQNHGLLGPLAAGPAYDEVSMAAQAAFQIAGVPFRSYDGLVEHGLFTDLDHLTAAGNARLAALLAADLGPLLRGAGDVGGATDPGGPGRGP